MFIFTFFKLFRRFSFFFLILPGQNSRIQPLATSKYGKCLEGETGFCWGFSQHIFVSSVLWDCKKFTIIFRSFIPNSLASNIAPKFQRCLLGKTVHLRPLKVGIYYSSSAWSLRSWCFSFTSSRDILLGLNPILSPLSALVNAHR